MRQRSVTSSRCALRRQLSERFSTRQRASSNFVLGHQKSEGTREENREKLGQLRNLRHDSITNAVAELGAAAGIERVFTGS